MGFMLIVVGVLMWIAENVGKQQRDLSSLDLADTLAIGAAQALAVVPGTSRSGVTITGGILWVLRLPTPCTCLSCPLNSLMRGAAASAMWVIITRAESVSCPR